MQKLHQLVKYSRMNSRIVYVIRDVTLHVHMTPLTVADRLLVNIAQPEKIGLLKK